jgi:hypothetical protein
MVPTMLLMAAAVTVVTGDFDRDGVLDQAFVRSANGELQVVIRAIVVKRSSTLRSPAANHRISASCRQARMQPHAPRE